MQKYLRLVFLVFFSLTLNILRTFSSVPIVDFEKVNVSWLAFSSKAKTDYRFLAIVFRLFKECKKCRGVSRAPTSIYDGDLCYNS